MSYRAFKRLLGETSLERKCRFLFGAGILLLITASFWLYALKTEPLAYEQTTTTGRLLVHSFVFQRHLKRVKIQEWEWRQENRTKDDRALSRHLGPADWNLLR